MEAILVALNDEHGIRRSEMRRLVSAWEDSGRTVEGMLRDSKELSKELKPYVYGEHGKPFWWAVPIPKGSGLQVMLHPEGPQPMTRDELLRDEPRLMFLHLLLNPLRDKLSHGPCGRCGSYYLKKRRNQKVYCGRRCGSLASAWISTRKKLEDERKKKVGRARALIQEWDALRVRPETDWKKWVHGRDKDITPKWLSTAINDKHGKYKLEPPTRRDIVPKDKARHTAHQRRKKNPLQSPQVTNLTTGPASSARRTPPATAQSHRPQPTPAVLAVPHKRRQTHHPQT